jgi:hypothetical protein
MSVAVLCPRRNKLGMDARKHETSDHQSHLFTHDIAHAEKLVWLMGEALAVRTLGSAVVALNSGDVDASVSGFGPSGEPWVAGFDHAPSLGDVGDWLWRVHAPFTRCEGNEDLLFGDARWRRRVEHQNLGQAPTGSTIDVGTCKIDEVGDGLVGTAWTGGTFGQLSRQIRDDQGDV